ncbi:hypothetical protein JWS13_04110 (plasmid) [Rhodococcus pseudokoreensis]|uniref:Uncharacterized protein n=1 Tax=Rhodococcus pseudokoreensis TaxID=2811421 RepID=A0A974ZRN7_9NOCA|nr:hypothetical protein [Rhodococcus pseudokoreensis]QSE87850.1 hypothetical protein JWS13_04110 [Rhodococcus pseudokoreensis]
MPETGPSDENTWKPDQQDAIGFAQRVKALATTAPLHELEARKAQVQTADYTVYQMSELALHTIDLVTIAMDFDTGAKPDQVLTDLARRVAAHAPDRNEVEHQRVARWVLENLLNVGSADRGFRTIYGVSGPDGYARRRFDFKLLEETLGPDGDLYLRASNEAVNVLVGALEIDLEAAHIAADVRLDILIKRGRLAEAQAAAQNARYRTIQYGEMLRQRLEATSRDVRNVDWAVEMPEFIEGALSHIEDRYRAENAILVNITEVRDNADTPARKAQAATLVHVVRDCLRRHDQLQAALESAGRRFRAEQDRQTFTHTYSPASLDLHSQLLTPVLSCSVTDADNALLRFFSPAAGLVVPHAVRLADLFDNLVTPPTERDALGAVLDEPDLSSGEESPQFPDASYRHLAQLLDLDPETPQRLSGLLADARTRQQDDPEADDLPLLVVVRVLALAAQEIAAARRHRDPSVLMAIDDGTPLQDPNFAGADLLVGRAALLDAADLTIADADTHPNGPGADDLPPIAATAAADTVPQASSSGDGDNETDTAAAEISALAQTPTRTTRKVQCEYDFGEHTDQRFGDR